MRFEYQLIWVRSFCSCLSGLMDVGRREHTLKLRNRSWFRGITRAIGVANKGVGCDDQCPVTLELNTSEQKPAEMSRCRVNSYVTKAPKQQ